MYEVRVFIHICCFITIVAKQEKITKLLIIECLCPLTKWLTGNSRVNKIFCNQSRTETKQGALNIEQRVGSITTNISKSTWILDLKAQLPTHTDKHKLLSSRELDSVTITRIRNLRPSPVFSRFYLSFCWPLIAALTDSLTQIVTHLSSFDRLFHSVKWQSSFWNNFLWEWDVQEQTLLWKSNALTIFQDCG